MISQISQENTCVGVFPVKFAKFLKNTFFYRTAPVASFKKDIHAFFTSNAFFNSHSVLPNFLMN